MWKTKYNYLIKQFNLLNRWGFELGLKKKDEEKAIVYKNIL